MRSNNLLVGIEYVFFDADDTLWHDAKYYNALRKILLDIGEKYNIDESSIKQLIEDNRTELGELGYFEAITKTAMILGFTNGELNELYMYKDKLLSHPIELMPNIEMVLERLSKFSCILVTKGNRKIQQSKIDRSGLNRYFDKIYIVDVKNQDTWERITSSICDDYSKCLAIGNSYIDDIAPTISLGFKAIWYGSNHGHIRCLSESVIQVPSWSHFIMYLQHEEQEQ